MVVGDDRVAVLINTVSVPESPSRLTSWGVGNARRVGLQEVDEGSRCAIDSTGEQDEEVQKDCACYEEQGQEAEDWC